MGEYFLKFEFEAGLDLLKPFSFSAAMLPHPFTYTFVMGPAAVTQVILERGRIRWLQNLIKQRLPHAKASRAIFLLNFYLLSWSMGAFSFLTLGYFHIDKGMSHYVASGSGLMLITSSICSYLAAVGGIKR